MFFWCTLLLPSGKLVIFALGLTIWLTLVTPLFSEEIDKELLSKAELAEQWQRLTAKLMTIQTQALQERAVVTARKDFLRKLKSSALRISPDQQKEIHEFFRVWEKFGSARKSDSETSDKATTEFVTSSKKIPGLDLKMVSTFSAAMQDDSVLTAKETLLESTLNAMKALDPETPKLIDRRQQLFTKLKNYPSGR